MRKKNRRKEAVYLTVGILFLLTVIYLAGLMITEDMVAGSFLEAKQAPGIKHLFGTDALGRDLFLRTVKGMSVSITVGLFASVISAVIALLVGIAAAAGSKALDHVINWIIDFMMGIPHTILIILISFAFGRGMTGLLIGIAATHWCSLARLIRAEVLQLRTEQYVLLSQKLGKGNRYILVNHLLPHLLPQFLVGLILMFPHAILHEAAISFLGFGLSPEQSAIGIILAESMRYLSTGMWWSAVLPGLFLLGIVLLIDQLGERLRMILDPYSAQE